MPLPTEEEVKRMHRYFAVECNNAAWDLAEAPERNDEQTQEMIRLAEVAAWHWSQVGMPINVARADMLLGWICNIVGQSTYAQSYTDAVAAQLQAKPEGMSEWDAAFFMLLEAYTRVNAGVLSDLDSIAAQLDAARSKLDASEQEVFDRFRAVVSA